VVVIRERCRSTSPISSSDAPLLSISMASFGAADVSPPTSVAASTRFARMHRRAER
jgi:hypothetical protein